MERYLTAGAVTSPAEESEVKIAEETPAEELIGESEMRSRLRLSEVKYAGEEETDGQRV